VVLNDNSGPDATVLLVEANCMSRSSVPVVLTKSRPSFVEGLLIHSCNSVAGIEKVTTEPALTVILDKGARAVAATFVPKIGPGPKLVQVTVDSPQGTSTWKASRSLSG